MKKTILITGGKGLCGINLVDYFQKKYEVYSLDRKKGLGTNIIIHDLQYPLPSLIFPVDYILHFAATIDQEGKNPDPMMKNNLLSTYNILDFALRKKVKRFIYASSSAIYGNPLTPYGLSKYLGEQLVNGFSNMHSLPITIFRLGYVIGTPLPKRYFIYKLIKKMEQNKRVILENPQNVFSFVSAEDIALFCEKALLGNISGTYNLTGVPKTIAKVFEALKESFSYQRKIKMKYSPQKLKYIFDASKTEKDFNLKFRDPFEKTFANSLTN